MNKSFYCIIALIPLLLGFTDDEWMARLNKPTSTILYVATNGHDQWSGALPEPNAIKTDGPFATLKQARDILRKLKKNGKLPDGAIVYVRGGTYYLDETFTLGPEDSGTEDHPIRYLAYKDEKPILSGAREIKGFQPYKGKILQADLKGTALEKINFRQLFADGKRQILARYPNFDPANPYGGGFIYVENTIENGSKRKFQYKEGTVHDWARPQEGEVFIFPGPNYWNYIIPIAGIDKANRIITLASDTSFTIYPIQAGDRYFIQNVFEELDAPGEWYLDRISRTLYFWPQQDITKIAVSAPVLKTVIEIKADPAAKHPPENIIIAGFTIEACEGTSIVISAASNCLIARSIVRNSGGNGIVINVGSHNDVIGNDVYKTGSAGIIISGGDRKTLTPSSHHARNNHVHHTGYFSKSNSGIECNGVGNIIAHNLVYDTPRIGIFFDGNDHIIEYNHVHHVNQETQDSGMIYMCARDWTKRGNVIRFNYVHDSGGYGRHDIKEKWQTPFYTWGIYLDDWTSGTKVYGNIVANTYYGGLSIHGGNDNVIENNVFIEGTMEQVRFQIIPTTDKMIPAMFEKIKEMNYTKYPELDTIKDVQKDTMMSGNKFIRNIMRYSAKESNLYNLSVVDPSMQEADFNTIFHFGLPLLIPSTKTAASSQWEAWRGKGFDAHSVVADPLFVDPSNGDYRLQPNSPALSLGFKPIIQEKIGLYSHPLRASYFETNR